MAVALPIDPLLPKIVASLNETPRLVLQAEPGAGKTTRVPGALLSAGLVEEDEEVWVVQPRRLAARLAASYVARENGEAVGKRIGYQVRYQDVTSRATRLRYVTDGVFLRRLAARPSLPGVGAVVFDEFHERRIAGDLGLAWLKGLQAKTRPDLILLVMSATLEVEAVGDYLAPCPILRAPGRLFPVEITHAPHLDRRPLAERVRQGLGELLGPSAGDLLVFLPGFAEIHRAKKACAELAKRRELLVLPLHGSLPPGEQERAVQPAAQQKLILATNVAETSVTIEGVGAVIDSGLVRVAGFDLHSGLSTLGDRMVSQASATQRAGRAGRTQAGRCLRLYTRVEHDQRPAFDVPEILRADLAPTLLWLAMLGAAPGDLDWLTPPPEPALVAARCLLGRLRALDAEARITELGRRFVGIPAHPRLARVLLAGDELGIGREAATLVALLGERDLRTGFAAATESGASDLAVLGELFAAVEKARFAPAKLRQIGINPAVAHRASRARDQLRRHLAPGTRGKKSPDPDRALRRAVLAGYSDRVAVATEGAGERRGKRELRLMNGQRLAVGEQSAVRDACWVVVVDAQTRRRAKGRSLVARVLSAIEPDWLLDLCSEADGLVAKDGLVWNDALDRVDEVSSLTYGSLTLDESRHKAKPSAEATEILRQKVREKSWIALVGRDQAATVSAFMARLGFCRTALPERPWPSPNVEGALADMCSERVALAELDGELLIATLRSELGSGLTELERLAPAQITLGGGRRLTVHYEPNRRPWVESWLQDFFGTGDGPRIAQGRVPLTLHLLAPNRRAVQVTADLANFWREHYPTLKRSLSRRYPRHDWPDNPATAKPPPPGGRRRRRSR